MTYEEFLQQKRERDEKLGTETEMSLEDFGLGPEMFDKEMLEAPKLPEYETPQGTSMRPITIKDFSDKDDLSGKVDIEDKGDNFFISEKKINSVKKDDSISLKPERIIDSETIDQYNQTQLAENNRIEQVLQDKLGDKYMGGEVNGNLSYKEIDGLNRRDYFDQRQDYFLRKYPDGRYFRVNTGGGKYEELYSFTKGGKVYKTSTDKKTFKEALGQLTGKFGRFSTLGSVLGSFFQWTGTGVFAGAGIGDMIDQAIMREIPEKERENFFEGINLGRSGTIATADAIMTKSLLGLPLFFTRKATGTPSGSNPFKRFTDETSVQKALSAEGLGTRISNLTGMEIDELPKLSVAQLINPERNPILIQFAKQSAGTAPTSTILMTRQREAVLKAIEALIAKEGGGVNELTARNLSNYIDLSNQKLSQELTELFFKKVSDADPNFIGPKNIDIKLTSDKILKRGETLKNGLEELIDRKYKEAFSKAGSDNVVFDLSSVREILNEARIGVRGGLADGPGVLPLTSGMTKGGGLRFTNVDDTGRIGGEVKGNSELGTLIENFLKFDPKVSNIVLRKPGKSGSDTIQETISSLKQMKTFRDDIQNFINADPTKFGKIGGDLIKAIDDAIANPVGGSPAFNSIYKEAGELFSFKSQVTRATRLNELFNGNATNSIDIAEKFWNGTLKARDWDLLDKVIFKARSVGPEYKQAGNELLQDVRNGFLEWLVRDPTSISQKLKRIQEMDDSAYSRLVNDPKIRSQIEDLKIKHSWTANSGVKANIEKSYTSAERSLNMIDQNGLSEAELAQLLIEKGGVDGKFAQGLRFGVLKNILEKSSKKGETGDPLGTPLDLDALSMELGKLSRFEGDYAKTKALFYNYKFDKSGEVASGKISDKMKEYLRVLTDLSVYTKGASQIKPGGELQTQTQVAQMKKMQYTVIQQLYTNKFLAAILSSPINAKALQKYHSFGGKVFHKEMVPVTSNLMTQFLKEWDIDTGDALPAGVLNRKETIEQEIRRRQLPPQLGNQPEIEPDVKVETSNLTTDDKPPINVSSLLPPVNRQNTQANSAKFASLFPRDNLGQAIADRSGIMGAIG